MRLLWGAVLLLVGCAGGDPISGCTLDNCRRMAESCRVDLASSPSADCTKAADRPATIDYSAYCVEDCRAQLAGRLVECIADRAQRCDAAPTLDAVYAIVAECQTSGGTGSVPNAGSACEQQCWMTRRSCDAACAGHAQFATCADCASTCGRDYVACAQKC